MYVLSCFFLLWACSNSTEKNTEVSAVEEASVSDDAAELVELDFDQNCNPIGVADDCFLPFPSLHFTKEDSSRPTGRRLDYQTDLLRIPDSELDFGLDMVNIADGVSPLTPAFVNFGVDIDPSFLAGWGEQQDTTVAGTAIALVQVDTGEQVPILIEMDQANRTWGDFDDRHPLILRPMKPMKMGERYMVILTDELRDVAGEPLRRSPVFDVLRDSIMTSNEAIEEMRPRYEDLFAAAENAGWQRSQLLLAWDFQVASESFILGPVRTMRDHIAQTDPDTIAFSIDEVKEDPNEHLAWLVTGTFQPPNFLNADSELVLDDQLLPVEQSDRPAYPFTMAVPAVAKERGDLGLILIGHGLFGNGRGMIDSSGAEELIHPIANDLGAVLISTNWIGLSSGDRDLILQEVLPNLDRVRLVTDRLVQSHANNLSLVELAIHGLTEHDVLPVSHDQDLVSGNKVFYYGISLGGIQGSSQTALSPRISRSVVAVPGAGWAHLIQRSTQFEPLEVLFDNLYPDPLTQTVLLASVQTFFDWSDPGNLVKLFDADDAPADLQKTIVIQEAIGDCQVSNIATDLLVRAMDAKHLENATDPIWGVDTVMAPYEGRAITQIRVPAALDDFFPPDENVTPDIDNNVHNDAVLRASIFEQISHLFETGELIHPCDGLCDPD